MFRASSPASEEGERRRVRKGGRGRLGQRGRRERVRKGCEGEGGGMRKKGQGRGRGEGKDGRKGKRRGGSEGKGGRGGYATWVGRLGCSCRRRQIFFCKIDRCSRAHVFCHVSTLAFMLFYSYACISSFIRFFSTQTLTLQENVDTSV